MAVGPKSNQGIKYVSLLESSGYGVAAKRYLHGLVKQGIPLTWTPMVPGNSWGLGYEPFEGTFPGNGLLDPSCNRPLDYSTVVVHMVPEYFPFWTEREAGKRIVGYTVWETDRIPRHWRPLLNSVDQLIVPCEWNRTVFEQCGVDVPISVVPHTAASFEGADTVAPPEEIRSTDFMFYTIGTWTNRKAMWKVLQCYWDTFSADDPVVLVIKSTKRDLTRSFLGRFHGSTRQAIKRLRRKYPSPARIRVITDDVDEAYIRGLHRRGDCFVSLCHSEGWGLGAFDAAAAGNPVIITGYGGQLDYLPEDAACLVNFRPSSVRDPVNRKSYSPDQRWADPDLAHACEWMKTVFDDRGLATAKGKALQTYIEEKFGEAAVTQRLLNAIGHD